MLPHPSTSTSLLQATIPTVLSKNNANTSLKWEKHQKDQEIITGTEQYQPQPKRRKRVEAFTLRHLDVISALKINRHSVAFFRLHDTSRQGQIETEFTEDVNNRIQQMHKINLSSVAFYIADSGGRILRSTLGHCIDTFKRLTKDHGITINSLALEGRIRDIRYCAEKLITPALQRLVIHQLDQYNQYNELKDILLKNIDRNDFQLLYGPPPKKCGDKCSFCKNQQHCDLSSNKLVSYNSQMAWIETLKENNITCQPYQERAPEEPLNDNELYLANGNGEIQHQQTHYTNSASALLSNSLLQNSLYSTQQELSESNKIRRDQEIEINKLKESKGEQEAMIQKQKTEIEKLKNQLCDTQATSITNIGNLFTSNNSCNTPNSDKHDIDIFSSSTSTRVEIFPREQSPLQFYSTFSYMPRTANDLCSESEIEEFFSNKATR